VRTGRFLSPFVAGILLTACSSNNSIWSQYGQILSQSIRGSTGQGTVTLEQAAAIPYASLAYRVDGNSEMLLVLATQTNRDLLWTAASRVTFLTRDGRILRTVGLSHNLGGTANPANAEIPQIASALKAPYQSTRIMDFPDMGHYGVPLTCTTAVRGRNLVTILGTGLVTTRIDETCQSQALRWSFTDSYWVDQDSGFVWQSSQTIHPSGTRVGIKILRPPE